MADELTEAFERVRPHLRQVAYRLLGSPEEAEDAVQEAWLRLHRSDTGDVTNLTGWLTTVVARISLDLLRSRSSRREHLTDQPEEAEYAAPVAAVAAPDPAEQAVLADTELLTSILTLHVVAGEQLSSADLAEMDSVTTVNGQDITLEVADDGSLLVNGQATVGCADVPTANATVHIIDAVLMPA